MTALARNRKKLGGAIALVALLVIALQAWPATAALRGRIAARIDLRSGHYKILVYGLPPADRPEFARLLRERYGIEMEAVASCTVSEPLLSYADAYNEVSIAAANHKFGRGVFEESEEEAERLANKLAQ
jgi:hypothetical protein